MTIKKIATIIIFILTTILIVFIISNNKQKQQNNTEKISIVTTIFPSYDFAKEIGKEKVSVSLLLPPGTEAHAYEPTPSDIIKINSSNIFVYTGEFMEPWANDVIKGINKNVKIVDASVGIELMKEENEKHEHASEENHEEHNDEHRHYQIGVDPHIWLNFENANTMAENIADALKKIDPKNADFYQNNLKNYQEKITALDQKYRNILSACNNKTIIYGGHYAFGYLAEKYNLNYIAAQGFSPDAEPTAKDLIQLINQIKKDEIKYIFYEELTSPKIAQTIANETNAKMLLLNAAHNISKDDYENKTSYISIMEKNLENLSIGLICKK